MQLTKTKGVFGIVISLFLILSLCTGYRVIWNSTVKGSVNPLDAGIRAWVVNKTDTVNAPVLQGVFMINNVKPGNYILMVEARPPYRDGYKQDVLVVEGQPTDVGVIEMNQ